MKFIDRDEIKNMFTKNYKFTNMITKEEKIYLSGEITRGWK